MRACPVVLQGTAWEPWIDAAPAVETGEEVDAFHRSARQWLAEKPGHNSALSGAEREALDDWLESYQMDLLRAKNDEPGIGDDRLLIGFWTLVGGATGGSIWAHFAISALVPASVAVPFGIALISLGFVSASVLKATRKARRWRMLNQIDMALESNKRNGQFG